MKSHFKVKSQKFDNKKKNKFHLKVFKKRFCSHKRAPWIKLTFPPCKGGREPGSLYLRKFIRKEPSNEKWRRNIH